jgi:hypothetical protein
MPSPQGPARGGGAYIGSPDQRSAPERHGQQQSRKRVPVVSVHRCAPKSDVTSRGASTRQSKVQIVHPYRSAADRAEAGRSKGSHNVLDGNVAVPMKVPQHAAPRVRSPQVDGKYSAARLQDPSNLSRAMLARVLGQVVQHQCAQHDIESPVRKSSFSAAATWNTAGAGHSQTRE